MRVVALCDTKPTLLQTILSYHPFPRKSSAKMRTKCGNCYVFRLLQRYPIRRLKTADNRRRVPIRRPSTKCIKDWTITCLVFGEEHRPPAIQLRAAAALPAPEQRAEVCREQSSRRMNSHPPIYCLRYPGSGTNCWWLARMQELFDLHYRLAIASLSRPGYPQHRKTRREQDN